MRDVPDVVVFALVVVVVVAVSAVALPASALGEPTVTAMAADGGTDHVSQQTAGNETTNGTEPLAPGQRLSGVVGVQGAEIDGELEERTLATRVSRSESNESKAAVVATELNTARDRLRQLRETQTGLREARRSGDISPGEYRARMAVTAARIQTVQTQLDSSEAVSRDLPDAALESNGVNREEIDRLREDAAELRGPEVAEIAREVAGDDGGREFDPDELPDPARDDAGRPDDPGNDEDDNGDAGRPDDPGNDDASGNRSTSAGPPDEADDSSGNSGEDEPGNSSDAGDSGDAGNGEDSSGNSDDAGNSNDAGDGDDSPGNSDDAGDSGDAGNGEDSPGNSDDAGNSNDAGDGDDSRGKSDDAGNSDGAGDSPGKSDDAGNSGNRGGGDR